MIKKIDCYKVCSESVNWVDGDNRNFAPENLERVSREEMCVMASMGNNKDMTRDEREVCLLRARIAIAKGKLVGSGEAARLKRRAWYERNKDNPDFKSARKVYHDRYWKEIKADAARYEEILRRNRERRKKR